MIEVKRHLGKVGIIVMMFVLFAGSPVQVFAAGNATKLEKDIGIKWITKNMCFYSSTLYCMQDYTDGQQVKLKMNASNKLYIAGILTTACYAKLNFAESRNFIINGNAATRVPLDMKFTSNLYKKLFGNKLNMSKVKQKNSNLIIRNGKCYAAFGDFGMSQPTYVIEQITKIGENQYVITATNYMEATDIPYPDGTYKKEIGTTWITVKKDKSAHYGYTVTKLLYQLYDW